MKKRKLKKKNCLLFIITILLILSLSVTLYNNYEFNIDTITNEIIDNEEIIEEVWPKETSFSMVTTGDALIHSSIYLQADNGDGTYDFSSIFSMVDEYINQFDIKYINQETIFASGSYSGYPLFNTPSEWGDAMIDAGFNLFSLATNHSYDQFSSGAYENVEYWSSQEGIGYAGMNSSEDRTYYTEEINGITYGFLSYTEHTNGLTVPDDESYLVDIYSYELAKEDIEYLEDYVDVIIVAMHWGTEYTSEPNDAQTTMASELSSLGVDVIIGSHPHWTQPIDYIGDTLVIYSLGNFISNQLTLTSSSYYTESVAVGALVSFDITKTTYETLEEEITVDNVVVELIYNYRDSTTGEYYVVPFSQMNETYNSDYLTIYEEHYDRLTMYSDLVTVNPLG